MKPLTLVVRVLLVLSAWTGLAFALISDGHLALAGLAYFTQVSNLWVAVAATVGLVAGLLGRSVAWLRGAAVTAIVITLVVFALLLGGDYSSPASLFCHLLTPLLAILDWLIDPGLKRLALWWPFVWLLPPLGYLVFYTANGEALYGFLDPGEASYWPTAGALTVAFVVVGLLVRGWPSLRRALARGAGGLNGPGGQH